MAGEYKGLNIINKESIEQCMETYLLTTFEDTDLGAIEEKGSTQVRYNFMVNGEDLYLDFYFSGNGKTTIQPYNGKQQEIKIQIAEYIKKELTSIISLDRSISIKNVTRDDFGAFIDLVSELDSVDKVELVENCYKVKGVQKDSATITRYSNGTVLMQGNPLRVFHEVTTLLSEMFLESNEMLAVYNVTYKTNINTDNINKEFDLLMSDSKDKLTDKLKIVIKQAIYNTHIEGEMFDYTFLVFPVLRALEGHIKYIAKDKGLSIKEHIGSLFNYNQVTKTHYLKEGHLVSNSVKTYLEKQYICYREQRNVYLHWDELVTAHDTTSLIGSRENSNQKIFDILKEINYYYTVC